LFGTPIPDGFAPQSLPQHLKLFPASLSTFESENEWRLFYPQLLKRPSEKLRWWAEMLFVARLADRRFLPLPPSLSFMYYVLRPLRLICKWGWVFLHRGISLLHRTLRGCQARGSRLEDNSKIAAEKIRNP
jgi:hypothetical protein